MRHHLIRFVCNPAPPPASSYSLCVSSSLVPACLSVCIICLLLSQEQHLHNKRESALLCTLHVLACEGSHPRIEKGSSQRQAVMSLVLLQANERRRRRSEKKQTDLSFAASSF